MTFEGVVEAVGKDVDAAGVAVIVVGAMVAALVCTTHRRGGGSWAETYWLYREGLGRAILLGLEFLVAADIIRTVAVSPTLANVGVLAIVVLIRTVLSVTLELELGNRRPWLRHRPATRQTWSE
jgi:uncharacterized membrane protein